MKQAEANGDSVKPNVMTCPTQYRLHSQHTTYSQNGVHDGAGFMGSKRQKRITMTVVLGPGDETPGRWPVSASTLPYFMDGHVRSGKWTLWRHAWNEMPEYFPHHGACHMSFFDGHVRKTYYDQEMWKGSWNGPYAAQYQAGYKTGVVARAF